MKSLVAIGWGIRFSALDVVMVVSTQAHVGVDAGLSARLQEHPGWNNTITSLRLLHSKRPTYPIVLLSNRKLLTTNSPAHLQPSHQRHRAANNPRT